MSTTKAPSYTMTQDSLTIVWEGKPTTVHSTAPNFKALKNIIMREAWDELSGHLTIKKSIASWAKGNFSMDDRHVKWKGTEVPTSFGQRVIDMAAEGKDPTCLFNFWERLQKNPSWRSVKQLWDFLKHANIPLTPDGCFLAYKSVKSDYTDVHTGTISNKPGVTNEMPRNEISDDPNHACHEGFHVGALGYARTFHSGGHLVVCKVDPEHVVCVPYDASQEKMRVCKYTVVGNYGSELPSTVYEDTLPAGGGSVPGKEDYEEPEEDDDDEELGEVATPDPDLPPEDDEDADDEDLEDDEEDGEGKSIPNDLPPHIAKVKPKLAIVKDEKKPSKGGFAKFNKMGEHDLMKVHIEELRKYASNGLDIVGASKIPGGKVALVSRILKVRK